MGQRELLPYLDYPYSEENLRMADREGFLVIDECAAVGIMSSLKNLVKRISRGSF